jgi:YHS domain-containing protein
LRRLVLSRSLKLALALILTAVTPAFAGSTNESGGVALKGHDPVAYFTDNAAVRGSDAFTATHDGVTYKFASAANRDAFVAAPARYLPRYGGFCAYGAAEGYKADIDPRAFSIVEGKLYLNYDSDIRTKWEKDVPGYIGKADRNWPAVSRSTKVYR